MGETTRNEASGREPPDRSGDVLRDVAQDVSSATAQAGSEASQAASRVRDEAAGAAADLKDQAAGVADAARERASGFAEEQKHAGAEHADTLARAAHRAADELQESSPQIAGYVREAASSVQQLAQTMRERRLGDLMGEVQNIARRQPVAFFGAAVLTGFAFSRFLKSSGDSSSPGSGSSTAGGPSSTTPGQPPPEQTAGDHAPSATPASATTLTVSGLGPPEAGTSRPGTSVEQP